MSKKLILILLTFFVVSTSTLFAALPLSSEAIFIEDKLGRNFTVQVEFIHTQRKQIGKYSTNWEQEFAGLPRVEFSSTFDPTETATFKAGSKIQIVEYSPLVSKGFLDTMDVYLGRVPLEAKLKEIFKVFTVTDEDGTVLLTLDTVSEANIRVGVMNKDPRWIYIVLDESLYE